jgi:hypothetical protein
MIKQKNNDLPEEFRKYFWDCEFDELSIEKYPKFIAERVLNFGDINSVKFLLSKIDVELIKMIVSTSRNLNNKTSNFWRIILYE